MKIGHSAVTREYNDLLDKIHRPSKRERAVAM
jgi:hypothetical protein